MRDLMRRDLVAAMKRRDRDAVAALRAALAVLDNAEAVPVAGPGEDAMSAGSQHVAGAAVGVGATEARRRTLDATEAAGLVRAERDRMLAAAEQARAGGRPDLAESSRTQARVLEHYLDR